MKVRILPSALGDIESAADWYEERREGLGSQFVKRVLEAVDRIALNPTGYIKVEGEARRCMVRRFQNALWFVIEPHEAVVIACWHGKRMSAVVRERSARNVVEMPKGPEPG